MQKNAYKSGHAEENGIFSAAGRREASERQLIQHLPGEVILFLFLRGKRLEGNQQGMESRGVVPDWRILPV